MAIAATERGLGERQRFRRPRRAPMRRWFAIGAASECEGTCERALVSFES